jgi:hypothetical protein
LRRSKFEPSAGITAYFDMKRSEIAKIMLFAIDR